MGLLIGLIIWALFVTAGYFVGKQKGRVGAGVALAALLGVAGVIIMACLPAKPAGDAEVQRYYDLQQAEASGILPHPDDLYAPPQQRHGELGAYPAEPPVRQL